MNLNPVATINGERIEIPAQTGYEYRWAKPEQVADRQAKKWTWCQPDGVPGEARSDCVVHDNGDYLLIRPARELGELKRFYPGARSDQ